MKKAKEKHELKNIKKIFVKDKKSEDKNDGNKNN